MYLTKKERHVLMDALRFFLSIENRNTVLTRYNYQHDEIDLLENLTEKILDDI